MKSVVARALVPAAPRLVSALRNDKNRLSLGAALAIMMALCACAF
jgi:hypothetical protein